MVARELDDAEVIKVILDHGVSPKHEADCRVQEAFIKRAVRMSEWELLSFLGETVAEIGPAVIADWREWVVHVRRALGEAILAEDGMLKRRL